MTFQEFLRLLLTGRPGFCQLAVTNACNAHCRFCGLPQVERGDRRTIDPARLLAGLEILKDRGIFYLCLIGGEPLLYPALLAVLDRAKALSIRTLVCIIPAYIHNLRGS